MLIEKKVFFKSSSHRLAGSLVLPDSEKPATAVIFLHGGGQSSKERFKDWQFFFAENNIASLAIDFTGVGESEGRFEEGSLNQRLKDAQAAVLFLEKELDLDERRLGVVGTSMGAHVAIRLLDKYPKMGALFLYAPAAYSAEAENKLLNEEFSQAVRRSESWQDSPVFKILENYAGGLMVVYSQSDETIPRALQESYLSLARAKGGQTFLLQGVGHQLLSPQTSFAEKARRAVYAESANFFSKYL